MSFNPLEDLNTRNDAVEAIRETAQQGLSLSIFEEMMTTKIQGQGERTNAGTPDSLDFGDATSIYGSAFPEVCKTPSPVGPIPVPYPVMPEISDETKDKARHASADAYLVSADVVESTLNATSFGLAMYGGAAFAQTADTYERDAAHVATAITGDQSYVERYEDNGDAGGIPDQFKLDHGLGGWGR